MSDHHTGIPPMLYQGNYPNPKDGLIYITKEIVGGEGDDVISTITITHETLGILVNGAQISPTKPFSFRRPPYGNYTITETPTSGYVLTSITPYEFSITYGHRQQNVVVVNTSLFTIKFGQLYNWFAATDPRMIANYGWHVPTQADWETTIEDLGGSEIAGGKLKEIGLTYWNDPNMGATNESGFNGRGAGSRLTIGMFLAIKQYTGFWKIDVNAALLLFYDSPYPSNTSDTYDIHDGFSLRLIKDTTALTNGQTGTYTGNDGQVYQTICTGTQEWLAENLNETEFRYSITIFGFYGAETSATSAMFRVPIESGDVYISFYYPSGISLTEFVDIVTGQLEYQTAYNLGWLKWEIVDDQLVITRDLKHTDGDMITENCGGVFAYFPFIHWDYPNIDIVPDNAAWAALTTPGRCYYDNDPNNALISDDMANTRILQLSLASLSSLIAGDQTIWNDNYWGAHIFVIDKGWELVALKNNVCVPVSGSMTILNGDTLPAGIEPEVLFVDTGVIDWDISVGSGTPLTMNIISNYIPISADVRFRGGGSNISFFNVFEYLGQSWGTLDIKFYFFYSLLIVTQLLTNQISCDDIGSKGSTIQLILEFHRSKLPS